MKINDKLSEIFDIEVVKEHDVIRPSGEVIPPDTNEEEGDFDKVRKNIHTLIELGSDGINFALNIAKDTEDVKAIHAFTDLLRAVTDTNMKLIEIHEKRARIKVKEPNHSAGQIVQNQQNVFVGTTADLSKFVKELNTSSDQSEE